MMKTTLLFNTRSLFFSFLLTLVSIAGWGQINYLNGTAIAENFNTLGTSSTANLPIGWKVGSSSSIRSNPINYTDASSSLAGNTAGNSMSNTASNGIYRFNANNFTTETAIGGLTANSGTALKSMFLYVYLNNTSSQSTKSFDISYNVEKYRNGSNSAGFSFQLFYSLNGTSWTSCGSDFLTTFTADVDSNGYTIAPNTTLSVNKSFTLPVGTSIATNQKIYFAWRYSVAGSGSAGSNAQALGIDDISITPKESVAATYTVTYSGNGSTGGTVPTDSNSPYASNASVTVLGNTGNLVRAGYKFVGWTTDAANTGTVYQAGDNYTISANTVFYAKWEPTYNVTYLGNGDTGGIVPTDSNSPYAANAIVTVLGQGSMTRAGYTFVSWNTAVNGSGTPYSAGNTFTISANTTLYAQWQQNAAITLSDNAPQVVSSDVIPGTDHVILSQFKIEVDYKNATLTEASVLFDGTYAASDIKPNGFKLWYSASNSFSGATSLSTKNAADNGGEVITFNTFSQAISAGSTGYLWVTADIANTAVSGHTIKLDGIANNDLTFSTTEITKSGNVSASGVKTFTTNQTIDYGNLQWPQSTSVPEGQISENIYAQVYHAGLTENPNTNPPAGIQVWIGISPKDAPLSSNPNTWTMWISAPYDSQQGNNDQYAATINSATLGLVPGTYRYASRFQLNGGPYSYGGNNLNSTSNAGGFWDDSTYKSGTLTVSSNLVDGGQVTLNPPSPNQGTASTATLEMYEQGLTDVAFPNNDVTVQFAYRSATDSNPSTWSGWNNFTGHTDAGNNDRFTYTLPANLLPGTYYVAARAQKNGSTEWEYFGKDWNTWSSSAVLNVQSNRVDWANIQNPVSYTMSQGNNVTVYSQVNKSGITGNVNSHTGITAWIGYSSSNLAPSESAAWTWIPATRNTAYSDDSNDEYSATFGAALNNGTYYYAAKYQMSGSSEFFYAGHTGAANTGGEWGQITPPNTTPNVSGVLIVQTPPEINIKQAANIVSGGTYAFGTQPTGTSSAAVTFTVENLGEADLILSGNPNKIAVLGTDASQFTVNETSTVSPITGNSTTTFTVTFSPTSTGLKTAQLSIANNDNTGSENPYLINLTGTGGPANDYCANAIPLVINDPAINGTFVNATASASPFSGTSKDVWYTFTPSCDGKFTFTLSNYSGQANMYLYATCGTATSIQNSTSTSSGNVLTTTPALYTVGQTYYLRIVANNAAAEASTFSISVNNQIAISTQPADQTVNAGTTATFTSSAPANQTERQWQVSTDGGVNWANISGATANNYTTPTTTMAMNGYRYRVIVKNGTCQTVESNSALLTVNPATLSNDIFASIGSGDWDTPATWKSSSDGGLTWLNPATKKPTDAATSIDIMSGHSVRTLLNEGARNLTIHTGATLNLLASLTNNGFFKVEDNANVIVNYNTANLGLNLWAGDEDLAPTSTVTFKSKQSGVNIFSVTSGIPNITPRTYDGYTALFGNLYIDTSTGMNAILPTDSNNLTYNLTHNDFFIKYTGTGSLSALVGYSPNITIGRDFIVENTSTGNTHFNVGTNSGTSVLNIKRDFIKRGSGTGEFRLSVATTINKVILNIGRDFIIEEKFVNLNQPSNAQNPLYEVNLNGDLNILGGGITVGNMNANSQLNSAFNFTGTHQTINYAGTTKPSYINLYIKNGSTVQFVNQDFALSINSSFTVENGGTLDFGFKSDNTALNLITGSGTGQKFTLQDGGTLKITSPDGIIDGGTSVENGLYSGNVQIGASAANRVFGTAATYHYIGKGTQQVSGNGLSGAAGDKKVIVELESDDVKFWATPEAGAGSVKRFTQNGWLEIRRGTVLDGQNPDVPSENYGRFADAIDTSANTSQSANLKMTGGRYVLYHSGYAMPHFSGTYDLTGGVIQFDGNDQSIRAPKTYLTVEVTGKKVGTPAGNITLKSISSPSAIDGSLTVKNGGEFLINNNSIVGETGNQTVTVESGGIFNTGDSDGFSGNNNTSVQTSIENITLEDGSTVEYSRNGDQLITAQSNGGQGTASYANLNIAGSGIKAPADNLEVNDKITVNAGELKIKSTQDNITSTDHHVPNVLWAHKGIINNGGIVTLENNAQLMQDDSGVTNSGMVNVQRKNTIPNSAFAQYVYWSSPVVPASNEVDKFFTKIFPGYTAAATYYSETNDHFYASSGKYIVGRGLAVKNPVYGTPPSPNFVMAELKGTPFNGPATFSMTMTGRGFNLVGNPYPTNLSLQQLYLLNGGDATATSEGGTIDPTFHLWDNVNNPDDVQEGSAYGGASYAIFNAKGTGTFTPANNSIKTFDGAVVSIGQGFMVKAIKADNKILMFNNTVRKPEKGIFFKSAVSNIDLGKYWLRLTNASSGFSTIAVTYSQGASNALESFDSKVANRGGDMFYSYVDDNKLAIQGRAYDFTTSDVVPLGMAHSQEGNYTISVWKKQGIFEGQQQIYLKDKTLGTVTDISEGSYSFQSTSGEFTNRFEIVYEPQTTLGTTGATKGDIIVYRDGNDFVIKSSRVNIQGVELYEVSGKLTRGLHGNAKELRFPTSKLANGVYILKIRLENGSVVTRKIIR